MRDERGIGLIEVLVVMGLLGLALGVFGTALTAMVRTSDASQDLGAVTDEARVALNQLDRQIRFGYWVKPRTISGASSAITVLTADAAGVLQCWTWAVSDGDQRIMNFVRPASVDAAIPAMPSADSKNSLWRVAVGPEGGDPLDGVRIAAGSSLVPASAVAPIDPATYTRPAGLYAGAIATLVLQKGTGAPVTLTFDMSVRNQWRGGGYATKC